MSETKYIESIRDDVVYSMDEFKLVLKSHGFKSSDYWIRKIEKEGYIPSSTYPTASANKKAERVYTGIQIRNCITSLLKGVEGK